MSADFLLELRCEEIPARMQAGARRDLARMFGEELQKARLNVGDIEVYSTPRRLALIARDVAKFAEHKSLEVKGPRTSAPPHALEGFLRKVGQEFKDLEERDGVYFLKVDMIGLTAEAILQDTIETIVRGFPWPKSMRWGEASHSTASLRWVRPLHGIVALLGEEIVPVAIDGIASGATTYGHRFHHPGPITIGGAHDYSQKLRACRVIVDHGEREALIRDGAATVAAEAGLALVEDEGLVVENAGLTEWPVPLLGRFDAGFLDVPREVIVLTMRANQKYFACTVPPQDGEGDRPKGGGGGSSPGTPPPPPSELRPDGPPPRAGEDALAPAFVCVANIDAEDGGERIVEGNKRVLAARLADARFFWEQDLKVPLEQQAAKLGGIVFHEKLGTVADKVERVAKLARWLVEQGIVTGADADQAERAARLAKADLVSGMVGEFPELQGVIGGYLARAQGEPDAIADAIHDHYRPVGQGDEVPTAPVTVAVALADKLDTLRSFFEIDEKPTGSRDPYALRRAALGAIQLIVGNDLRLPVAQGELLEFFADRLKVQQREAGVRHDLIDAVFALGGEDDLVRLLARVKALQAFVETSEGADLLTGYKRAANILKREKWTGPEVMSSPAEQGIPQTGEEDPLVLVEEPGMAEAVAEMASGSAGAMLPHEQALVEALDAAEPEAGAAVQAEDFTGAMAALARLRGPIDDFFDHVTVNDPDASARERRLNLLMRFRDAVHRVADFSKIER